MREEPTDEQLIAFAAETLSELGASLRDAGVLAETITENRELWQSLYRLARGPAAEQSR